MRQTIKYVIIGVFVSLIGNTHSFAKEAGNGITLKSGDDYPVCKELVKIMNLPENAHSMDWRTKEHDIVFPKRYKNFAPVLWQPISLEEAKQLTPPGYLDKVMVADKDNAVNLNKDWDGKGDFVFEKATIDYDNQPPAETILRYRFPGLGKGNCLFAKDTPITVRDQFNPSEKRGAYASEGEGCEFFYYGGRAYHAKSSLGFMYILQPQSIGYQFNNTMWNVDPNKLCFIKKLGIKTKYDPLMKSLGFKE